METGRVIELAYSLAEQRVPRGAKFWFGVDNLVLSKFCMKIKNLSPAVPLCNGVVVDRKLLESASCCRCRNILIRTIDKLCERFCNGRQVYLRCNG